jgi:hypothetical protein
VRDVGLIWIMRAEPVLIGCHQIDTSLDISLEWFWID